LNHELWMKCEASREAGADSQTLAGVTIDLIREDSSDIQPLLSRGVPPCVFVEGRTVLAFEEGELVHALVMLDFKCQSSAVLVIVS
jgi:hypothetical protein